MKKNVTVLADSIAKNGCRLTTLLFHRFPKVLLAELNTHALVRRSVASARAIPVKKYVEMVRKDPYIPQWTSAQSGMTGGDNLSSDEKNYLTTIYLQEMDRACQMALRMHYDLKVAKQDANRLLDQYVRVPVVATSTDWGTVFVLRDSHLAQPEFAAQAHGARIAMAHSIPVELQLTDWHIAWAHKADEGLELNDLLSLNAARSARTSYNNQDGPITLDKANEMSHNLEKDGHTVPFEHAAKPSKNADRFGTYRGWLSHRWFIENGINP